MERYDEKVYDLAKSVIKNAINKIRRDKVVRIGESNLEIDTAEANEMKNAVEMLIMAPLAHESDEIAYDVSPEIRREIEAILSVFDEVYEDVYKEVLSKEAIDSEEETIGHNHHKAREMTIQEKADMFNAQIREFMKSIKIENNSNTKSNIDDKKENSAVQRKTKKLKYRPISNGKMGPEQEVDWDR